MENFIGNFLYIENLLLQLEPVRIDQEKQLPRIQFELDKTILGVFIEMSQVATKGEHNSL